MANSFSRDDGGAALIEFTVVFPLLAVVTLGLIDLGYLMFAWSDTNRAAQWGARYVATHDPMALGIAAPIRGTGTYVNGTSCDAVAGVSPCIQQPTFTCTFNGSTGTCSGSDGSSKAVVPGNFSSLVTAIDSQMPSRGLDPRQIVVTYVPLQQGYVGRSVAPMNVTVKLQCIKQELFFVDSLLGLIYPPMTDCPGLPDANGFRLDVSSTLPSEDLTTD